MSNKDEVRSVSPEVPSHDSHPPPVQLISSLNQLSPSVLCTPSLFNILLLSFYLLFNLQRRRCPKAFLANLAMSDIRGTQAGGSREACFNIAGELRCHTSTGAAGRHRDSRLKSLWINDSLASEVFSNWCVIEGACWERGRVRCVFTAHYLFVTPYVCMLLSTLNQRIHIWLLSFIEDAHALFRCVTSSKPCGLCWQ